MFYSLCWFPVKFIKNLIPLHCIQPIHRHLKIPLFNTYVWAYINTRYWLVPCDIYSHWSVWDRINLLFMLKSVISAYLIDHKQTNSSSSLTRNKQKKKSYTVKSHNTKIFIRKPECIKCHLHLIVIGSDTLYSPVEIQATLIVADKEERRSLSWQ